MAEWPSEVATSLDKLQALGRQALSQWRVTNNMQATNADRLITDGLYRGGILGATPWDFGVPDDSSRGTTSLGTTLDDDDFNQAIATRSKEAMDAYGPGSGWEPEETGSTGLDPRKKVPDDQQQDQWGQWLYLQDENGYWFSNPKYGINPNSTDPKDPKDPKDPDGDSSLKKWHEHLRNLSARGAMRAYLGKFNLEKISDWAIAQIASGYDVDTIVMQMRYGSSTVSEDDDMYVPETVRTVYDTRFPAMAKRDADPKTAPLTEAGYIDLETGYWAIIDAAGLNAYADAAITAGTDLISDMIIGDVSLAEFRGRVDEAEEVAFNTNSEVQAALQRDWNWSKGEFITAMFDPDSVTLKEAKRRRRGAVLSGTSQRALGGTAGGTEMAFSERLGRDLLALDVQGREVQAQMAALTGLTSSTMHSGGMSADQLGEGVWGSGKARAGVRRELEGRKAGFSGRSGGLATAGGMTSFGTTNT